MNNYYIIISLSLLLRQSVAEDTDGYVELQSVLQVREERSCSLPWDAGGAIVNSSLLN
jgi:hypothetical protein